jgi:hypothetical protein
MADIIIDSMFWQPPEIYHASSLVTPDLVSTKTILAKI